MIIRARKCLWHKFNVKLRWCRVQTVVVHVDWSWLYCEALRASAELKHSLFSVIFTSIFIPKNKMHRKYVHLFRPKNKKMRFSAPETKKKMKFGRPLIDTLQANPVTSRTCFNDWAVHRASPTAENSLNIDINCVNSCSLSGFKHTD